MSSTTSSPLLTREQAAEYLGVKVATLENWATTRHYKLPFIKVGRLVRYRLADIERFLSERTIGGEN